VRFSFAQIPTWNEKTKEQEKTDFLILTVSCKLLKQNYFKGINKHTIKDLFNTFLTFNIFNCTFETFKNGIISDIDICINRYCPTKKAFFDICSSLISQADIKGKYCKLFQDEENKGIGLSFNNRNWASPSLPFIKLYHKELELNFKSKEFTETFLQGFEDQIKDLTRIEATIKNWKHKKRLERYGIIPKFSTLEEFLQVPQENLFKFIMFSLTSYIVKSPRVKAPELSPTDHLIFELIQNCILKGYDYKNILSLVETFKGSSPGATAVAHSRMKKKLTDLFDLAVFKDAKIYSIGNHNTHVLEYLRYLQVDI
jgi:hypothetical protein